MSAVLPDRYGWRTLQALKVNWALDVGAGNGALCADMASAGFTSVGTPHLLPAFVHPVLSAGGHLMLSTRHHGYLKNLALSWFNKWDHHRTVLWHGGHIKFWSRASLSQLLHDNGFDGVAFHGVGRVPCLWKRMVPVARKRAGDPGPRGT